MITFETSVFRMQIIDFNSRFEIIGACSCLFLIPPRTFDGWRGVLADYLRKDRKNDLFFQLLIAVSSFSVHRIFVTSEFSGGGFA